MAARDEAVVIGSFPDPEAAAEAIRELKEAGFTDGQISAVMRQRGPAGELLPELVAGEDLDREAEAVKTGAATGGILGGVFGLLVPLLIPGLGPITLGGVLASMLVGAGAGVVTGGLVGMLVGMGVSRAEAEYFDRAVRSGGVLVIVQPGDPARRADARSILRDAGADLGSTAAASGTWAEAAEVGGEPEPWRGNERRYHQDTGFAGPERRKAHAER